MLKEIEELKEDNAGKSERDRMALWRKLKKIFARNDDIVDEWVRLYIIFILLICRRVCQCRIASNDKNITTKYICHC